VLFSDRSVWTMVHGIALGGAALVGLFAALFTLTGGRAIGGTTAQLEQQARRLSRLIVFIAVALWLTILVGTYVVFPPYRVAPPEGLTDLTAYSRSFLLANPDTAWLHAFGMEIKEHVPWIAAMLATAVAFIGVRQPAALLADERLRRTVTLLLAVCFALVAFVALMGVFVDKVTPLQ
jgi:hypothetical protein